MHGLTEGRSVRPAVRPGEGNSPTIKPYREYVPLVLFVVKILQAEALLDEIQENH